MAERYLQPETLKLAEELAAESIVLLKNEHDVLPIAATARRIALIGPLAKDRATMLGTWAQRGEAGDVEDIGECLRKKAPAGVVVESVRGCDIDSPDRHGFADAVRLAKTSDVVVLCLGEATGMSAENASRSSIKLPGVQEELALEVAAAGRPLVLVLSAGRPVALQRDRAENERHSCHLATGHAGRPGGRRHPPGPAESLGQALCYLSANHGPDTLVSTTCVRERGGVTKASIKTSPPARFMTSDTD